MTIITQAIRAAEEWAARLPKLPAAEGPVVDVAAPLREATRRDQHTITVNIHFPENNNDHR